MAIFGNIPGEDSGWTRDQKRNVEANLATIGVELPSWVATNSYLADLKTLERIIFAAHRARPGVPLSKNAERYPCCEHCDHSITQPDVTGHAKPCPENGCQPETPGTPDSSTEGAPDGVDRAIKG